MTEQELLSYLKEYIDYNPDTGVLTWVRKPCNSVKVGEEAGCLDKFSGYRLLRLRGKLYKAHRIAWLMTYGNFPKNHIDHINQIKDDNRIINLRDVEQVENNKNASKRHDNTSGCTGINFDKKSLKWRVRISINKKRLNLGSFENLDEAIKVRKEAEKKYGFHENHGR